MSSNTTNSHYGLPLSPSAMLVVNPQTDQGNNVMTASSSIQGDAPPSPADVEMRSPGASGTPVPDDHHIDKITQDVKDSLEIGEGEEGGEDGEDGEKKEGDGEGDEDDEDEEEEPFVPRRSGRIRKPVIMHVAQPTTGRRKSMAKAPPKEDKDKDKDKDKEKGEGESDSSSLSEEPAKKPRRRKSTAAKKPTTDGDGDTPMEGASTPATTAPKRKRKRPDEEGANGTNAKEEGEGGAAEGDKEVKKRASKKKKVTAEGEGATTGAGDAAKEEGDGATASPKRKRTKKPKPEEGEEGKPQANGEHKEGEEEDGDETASPKPKRVRKKAPPKEGEEMNGVKPEESGAGTATATGEGGTGGAEGEGDDKPKRVRKPKVKEPIVYVIPDVEKKTTTFKGRLGYACINTVLRAQKPAVFSSRTCRIDTIVKSGIDHVKELGRQNVKDLLTMIEWNEQNNIRFMRMSSDMFPFASHTVHGYDLSYCAEELKAVGDLAKKYGHRLTMHPGQFTQLASPKENVVDQSIKELEYHAELMDRMGLDQDSVMIIHMGGVYGDKMATLTRFRENYQKKLSDAVKRRLVLENDEICYNVDDLLKVCPQLNIPIVFDYHHDSINPSRRPASELIPLVNQTWQARGIRPKQHYSQARPGAVTAMELRAHSDRCNELPAGLPDDMDLMIEAKDKEQAVFELYRIYDLQPVVWENLRPPADEQTLKTKGRKSVGKKPKKEGESAPVPEAPEQPIDPEMIDELADDDDII